ncbi:MAG: GNAT family N-acetyltransferase [Neisseriaceae bacterium]|nr:GNAT family N-acetyltransferase [Neisseriaceae bacterium]
MLIHPAQKNHTASILRLYQQLTSTMAALQPTYFKAACQDPEFIHNMIEADNATILVAVQQQRVVGFAMLQQQATPPYPMFVNHQYAFLLDLIVDQNSRGQGIATQLLDACKTWTTDRQLAYLELNVLANNLAALKLYQQQDFHAKMHSLVWTPENK